MQIRDRIKAFRRVKASELRPNALNWRTHPETQRTALRDVLVEVGYANALLARELDDGSLELIDGHLRAETTPDQEVPVLVLDVSQVEANTILATLDPLAALAVTDAAKLDALLRQIQTGSATLGEMLADLADEAGLYRNEGSESAASMECDIPETFQVVAECEDEWQQRELYERLASEGYPCRVLTL